MLGRIAIAGATAATGLAAAAPAQAATPAAAAAVGIVNHSSACASLFCFKPGTLRVAAGTVVTWTNRSSATHIVTRCTVAACGSGGGTGKDRWPGSGPVAPRGTYAFTFHGAGTYRYYCSIHGFSVMHGTITVP